MLSAVSPQGLRFASHPIVNPLGAQAKGLCSIRSLRLFFGCARALSNYSCPHMGNSFGQLFRVTTFGESHGGGIGVVVDGCPPRIDLSNNDIQRELDRRRPGQSKITTQRKEPDKCEILSGVFGGKTLGTPITVLVRNEDARPEAYETMRETFRPSHADFTYQAKYGIRNWQGGGRASARETIGRVAAAAIARNVLATFFPKIEIIAFVSQVHQIIAKIDRSKVKAAAAEASILRCPDKVATKMMVDLIEKTRAAGDSLGGVIECVARNIPAGLGEPVFDKLEADLAKAMLSLPATKGFEIGSGFAATRMHGSEHNDAFEKRGGRIVTRTNFSGGIQGGISNGEEIYFRVAFKPTATIAREQDSVTSSGKKTKLAARGRHDPCVLPRAVPMVEAMTALVLCDHALRQKAISMG
jgi:chorismate synthase